MTAPVIAQKKRTIAAYAIESEYSVLPGSPPQLKELIETNDTIKTTPEYERSGARRSDGNRPPSFLAGAAAGGSLGIQFIYEHYDDLIVAMFRSSGYAASEEHVTAGTGISFQSIATSSSNYAKILDAGAGFANYDPGQSLRIVTGSGTNDKKAVKIRTVAAGEMEIEYGDFVTEDAPTAGATTITQFGCIENGTTRSSILYERRYTDQTVNPFSVFYGGLVGGGELVVRPKQLIAGSLDFVFTEELTRATTIGNGSNIPKPVDTSMNAVQNIGEILIGGQAHRIAQITFRTNNGLVPQDAVGNLRAFDYAEDDFGLGGEIQVYYDSGSAVEFEKSLAGEVSSVYASFNDVAGNQHIIDIPTMKIQDADRSPGDTQPGGIIATLPFEAEVTEAEGITGRFCKLPAA